MPWKLPSAEELPAGASAAIQAVAGLLANVATACPEHMLQDPALGQAMTASLLPMLQLIASSPGEAEQHGDVYELP